MKNGRPKTHRIALLPGDGIGPEVVAAAIEVLCEAESRVPGLCFDFEEFAAGAGEYIRRGNPFPEDTLERLREFDAIFLGAMGLPEIRWPNGLEISPQLDLREQLELYCGPRPIYLFHPSDSPLRDRPAGSIDFVLVRESTEGLFSSRKNPSDAQADAAEDRLLVTRPGAERVIRAAFAEALGRRRSVTLVDKANVLPSMVFFRRIFDEISHDYPEVKTERMYVDAVALQLLQRPETFDVLVTENMFGDILSDLSAGLVGGMGMAPSADIGSKFAVFQPAHGSAPDLAAKGIANPVAAILSAAMMAEWIENGSHRQCARMIREAVARVFGDPRARTPDMGGRLTTEEMTAEIVSALSSN